MDGTQRTFVLLRAIHRGGQEDRVEHAAVLASEVRVTDALHLITARLGRETQRETE